jgi:hypothetical protein
VHYCHDLSICNKDVAVLRCSIVVLDGCNLCPATRLPRRDMHAAQEHL